MSAHVMFHRPYWWSDEAWALVEPFEREEDLWMDLHFGPGHIVFEDGNLDDSCIDFCLGFTVDHPDWTPERHERVYAVLRLLKSVPEDRRSVPDTCPYCETFPCAQLAGCEPYWTGEEATVKENEE